MKKKGVIIVGGGSGSRMGAEIPKQFLLLEGKPVMARTIEVFRCALPDADIIAAIPPAYIEMWCNLCLEHEVPRHKICEGGNTRFGSVENALAELDRNCAYIAVHDAVRPLVTKRLIDAAFGVALRHGTAIPVTPVTDSIRRITGNSSRPVDRNELRFVQTPQVFRADILHTGYERAASADFTDDASVVESIGYNIMLFDGEKNNIKITSPVDLTIAEAIIHNGGIQV